MRLLIIGLAVLAVAGTGYWVFGTETQKQTMSAGANETALVEIKLPKQLSANATVGKTAYEAKCASCHGLNAVGQDGVAPPLVHKIYEPSHHGDEAFQRAAAQGVRSHHWRFGNMPPVEGLTRADVTMIVAYVRELQRANGIN
jgi:cytochrome c